MNFILGLILDFLIIAILFIYVVRGFRRGFVRSIAYFLGNIASFFVAWFGSRLLSDFIGSASRTFVLEQTRERLGDVVGQEVSGALMQLFETFPKLIQTIVGNFIGDPEVFFSSLSFEYPVDVAALFTDHILLPMITSVAFVIMFFVLFFLCRFLIKRIVPLLGFIKRIPLIGSVDCVLGAILGIFQAGIFLILFTTIVAVYMMFTGGNGAIINETVLSDSTIFEIVYQFNLLNLL